MSRTEQVTKLLHEALVTVNETLEPGERLAPAPDTVLIGESGGLGSLAFVTFAVTVEEGVDRTFEQSISVIDLVSEADSDRMTVADLARLISETLESEAV